MKQITLSLPANWDEIISAGKYLDVIRVLNTSYANPETDRLAMLQALTGLNGFDLGKQLGAGTASQRAKVAGLIGDFEAQQFIDFVFPALDFIYTNQPFYQNPVPSFTHNGIEYAGPGARLHDQTGEEWMITHQAQVMLDAAPDGPMRDSNLLTIIAANFHRVFKAPAAEGLGGRAALNDEQFIRDKGAFTGLPPEIVTGIYLWYKHCDEWWFNKFPHLFSTGEANERPQHPQNGFEVRDIVFELAGNKLDAAWDIVKKRSRQDIFYTLDRLNTKRIEFEEEMEKARNK